MDVRGAAGPDDIYWAVYNNEYSIMGTEGDWRGFRDGEDIKTSKSVYCSPAEGTIVSLQFLFSCV